MLFRSCVESRWLVVAAIAVVSVAIAQMAVATPIVADPSFENWTYIATGLPVGNEANWAYGLTTPDNSASSPTVEATDWTLVWLDPPNGWSRPGGVQGSLYYPTEIHSGNLAAFIDSRGAFQQSVGGFAAGQPYTMSFWTRGDGSDPVDNLQVSIDSTALTFGASTTIVPNESTYTQYTSSAFTVATGAHALSIAGLTTGNAYYTLLDDVSINTVPEPSTIALLATGLLGLLAYAWRKRR